MRDLNIGAGDIFVGFIAWIVMIVAICWLIGYFRNPFEYPYFKHTFDGSGKRIPDAQDYIRTAIDNWLKGGGVKIIERHHADVLDWYEECENTIANSRVKSLRQNQYSKICDPANGYIFILTRDQTRYRQQNYVRYPYKVSVEVGRVAVSYKYLHGRCVSLGLMAKDAVERKAVVSSKFDKRDAVRKSSDFLREQEQRQRQKYFDVVKQTSKKCELLNVANQNFVFKDDVESSYYLSVSVQSKSQLDKFDYEAYMRNRVRSEQSLWGDRCKNAVYNRVLYSSYLDTVSYFADADEVSIKPTGVPYDIYLNIESELCSDLLVRPPVRDFRVVLKISYTSPQGRNTGRRSFEFTCIDIIKYLETAGVHIEVREDPLAKYDFGIRDGLRYDVMKRDGYRCTKCGKSADDNVTLKVMFRIYDRDNIDYNISNLRTLCDKCLKHSDALKAYKNHHRDMITKGVRERIAERYGYRCKLCGATKADGVKFNVDHDKPLAKGGMTVESNLQLLCENCNKGKSDKWDE